MNKAMSMIRILLVGIGCVVLIAMWCIIQIQEANVVYIQDPNYVQNIGEAQQRLKEQGLYHGKIDYIWGKETDRAYCDWCAIRAIKGK
jgi:hypothetical protein